jgi:hypothetical protein
MFPSNYICTGCRETFHFGFRRAQYYVGTAPLGRRADGFDLLDLPVRPGWCKDCEGLCLIEDIAPLRAFEAAYGAVRQGQVIDYPVETENFDASMAQEEVGRYLQWRMARRHAPRALCCGGSNHQFMDVAQPLFKHAGCESGVVEPQYFGPGAYVGPGPGVYSAANIRVYSPEGELIGVLTWSNGGDGKWDVEPMGYTMPSGD